MKRRKPCCYVVVENAGCDDEKEVYRTTTFVDAFSWAQRLVSGAGSGRGGGYTANDIRAAGVDVMSVNQDGSFSTEI
jgi:hypothetical protein